MGSLGQRFQQITTKGVNKMDRRNFLAGAAVAAGAAALTGMTGCATNNDLPSTGDVDLKALAKEIDRLASIEEIRAQLFNYIQAVDRIDYELGYSVFAEDSLLDYGSYYYDIFPNMTGRQFIDSCLGDHLNGCKWTHANRCERRQWDGWFQHLWAHQSNFFARWQSTGNCRKRRKPKSW